MDPRILPEHTELTPESTPAAGASYLRNLKSQVAGGASAAPAEIGARSASFADTERRRAQRYRCRGSVEFKAEGGDVRMWGTLTDISLHGCYVEMTTTFPVATKIELNLDALGIRVHASGIVRVSYPFLGMGISFTEIEPGQLRQLEELISALAGESPLPTAITPRANLTEVVSAADPAALLDGIRQFFEKNKALTREDFTQLAKRSRKKF